MTAGKHSVLRELDRSVFPSIRGSFERGSRGALWITAVADAQISDPLRFFQACLQITFW